MTRKIIKQVKNDKKTSNSYLFSSFLMIIGLICLVLIVYVKSSTAVEFLTNPILFIYTVLVTTFQLSRILGALLFKRSLRLVKEEAPEVSNFEPTVTFVVPCKNEGPAIGKTIDKCFQADYPKEKVEVIVINDGSTDNTLEVLTEKQKEYPELVVVDWKINRGKRHGMAEGFKRAKGEIIVQLDSDSYIEPETFRKLIEPFQNPQIGAVCAHADPENADTNILTKMQAAYYFMSFRILKAAESAFWMVFCCSGCSSAYRKDIVLPIMDTWLEETFLGLPVTWGDDRSLTNRVLALGYATIYTDEVKAFTIVPEKMKQLLKQQVRWKKGWFVNSIFASKFVIKKSPFVAFSYFFPLILLTLATPFMAVRALIWNPVVNGVLPFYYMSGIALVAIITTVYYRHVSRENKYWPYIFLWSALNMVILSFILFYSLATIQNRKWGTR